VCLLRGATCLYTCLSPRVVVLNPSPVHVKSVVGVMVLDSFFSSTSVFPCHHSTDAPYSSSSTCFSYQKGKLDKYTVLLVMRTAFIWGKGGCGRGRERASVCWKVYRLCPLALLVVVVVVVVVV
jgi:hypothetical protein